MLLTAAAADGDDDDDIFDFALSAIFSGVTPG